jgi:methionyl-tRNA synthetase
MSETQKKFYLTTPIYYVNARPHIGHAYTTIAADVIARRHRLLGDDTFFLTGTDEHGQKIERSAAAAGVPPQQFADQVSASFENLWKRMGITNNDFIRTTSDKHKRGVQHLFSELYKNGFIYLASYTGSYCVSDEAFVDAPVGTPCPDCGRLLESVTEENFFFKLSAFQLPLIDLIESNTLLITPDARRNEVLSFVKGNWMPELSKNLPTAYKQLEEQGVLNAKPEHAVQHLNTLGSQHHGAARRTKADNFYVPGALKDLSISRSSFTWGIPVPEPAASAAAQKHVIYVWLDALANYMTALGYGSEDPADIARFEKYWPADLHLVGKEIIRFHCVYWPAFLMAANLPLPKAITAHGWLLFEDSKMSKSRGNIVRTETILDAFGTLCPAKPISSSTTENPTQAETALLKGTASAVPQTTPTQTPALAAEVLSSSEQSSYQKHQQDLFASDVLRYFLLREIPFGQDGSFSFDALVQRYNSDLANGYGNLVSRTLKMIDTYCAAAIPASWSKPLFWPVIENGEGGFQQTTGDLRSALLENLRTYNESIETCDFSIAVSAPMAAIAATDRHISDHAPWKLAKAKDEASQQKLREILYTAAESIRIITALLYPILPYATAKVWAQLGLGDIEEAARKGELNNLIWGGLQPGTKLGPLAPIFPRAPKELIQLMTDMEQPTAPLTTEPTVDLPHVNSDHDASASKPSPFREAPISSLSSTPALNPIAESVHPASAHPSAPIVSPEAAPATPTIPTIAIDDFVKIDLRVAQIVVAERIPKADKLLRLEVDLGYEKRQILSGIAEWYTPEELIGRRIVVIANLAPRKMRGLESHGMLLAASAGDNGKPVLATFGEDIALGSRLR